MGEWCQLELLSITPEALVRAMGDGLRYSQVDLEKALQALRAGQTPAVDVLRVSGSEEQPSFENLACLLHALATLGYLQLPVIATKPAARWLREQLQAELRRALGA